MKILVLQLARFGDIYQTWPCLSGLRRKYPDAEIHLGVRERYARATEGLTGIDRIIAMPTKKILAPLIFSEDGIEDSLVEMDRFFEDFDSDYDQIINFSFSPFSSYLVEELKSETTRVMGYDRFEDGFLKINDDASAYFYGQVGVGRFNRLHLVDVFAMIAEVELEASDCDFRTGQATRSDRPYLVIHVGASRAFKTCDSDTWEEILRVLLKKTDYSVYLVGTRAEKIDSEWISTQNRIVDFCGETELKDLFPLLEGAEALIAGDSMMIQVANLANTKSINISFPSVNFWETGPRVAGSRVIMFDSPDVVESMRVCQQLEAMRESHAAEPGVFVCDPEDHLQFRVAEASSTDFQWALIKAMYMGTDYPVAEKMEIVVAIGRIHELACLGLDNLSEIKKNPQNQVSMGIIGEIDQLLVEVGRRSLESQPLVQWFLTEKLRIGPGRLEEVLEKTFDVFDQLRIVSNLYTLNEELPIEVEREDLTWK